MQVNLQHHNAIPRNIRKSRFRKIAIGYQITID